jgi:hypothetical protein
MTTHWLATWDVEEDTGKVLLAGDERMDHRIHQGVHNMLTKQDTYPLETSTHLLNTHH